MSKSFLLSFAVALLAITCLPLKGRTQQQTAPAPAPATTPAPGPAPALNPPETVAPPPAAPVRNPVKPTAESQAKAKTLYRMDCAMCHGDNGNGKTDLATSMELTLNDWTDPKALAGRQDWELFNIIRVGKGKMPPESKGRATDSEVWNIVIYIRTLSK
jgi:mono/diheme cytochrome c family protein